MKKQPFINSMFIILLLGIAPFYSFSQLKLTIHVLDSATGDPLGYSTVYLNNHTHITDNLGTLVLKNIPSQRYDMTVHHIGCEKQSFSFFLTRDSFVHVRMPHHIHVFDEVLTLSKYKSQLKTFSNYQISYDKLMRQAATTLQVALEEINGVQFLKTGVGIGKPIIQGMYGSRVAINLGETKLESQQWGNDHAPEIDPLTYGQITLVKGPGSLIYGGDGVGGLILLQPSSFDDSTYYDLTFMGSTETNSGGLIGAVKLEQYSKNLQMGHRFTISGFKHGDSRAPNYVLSNTSREQLSLAYFGQKKYKLHTFELSSNYFTSKIGVLAASHVGNLTDLNRNFENNIPSIVEPFSYEIETPYQDVTHFMFRFKHQYEFNKYNKLTTLYTYQKNNRFEFDQTRLGALLASLDLQLTTHQLFSLWETKLFHNATLKSGFNADYQENTFLGRFFIPNYRKLSGGLFSNFEWIGERSGTEVGLRYDISDITTFRPVNQQVVKEPFLYDGMSAAISSYYKWNEDVTSFLNIGSRFRIPNMNELFSAGLHHGVGALEFGDINMLPERSYSVSTATIYNHNQLRINIEPFFHHFNQYIFLAPSGETQLTVRGAFPIFEYQQSNVNYFGLDADAQYSLKGKWLLYLAGQMIYVRDITNNAFVYGIAPPSVSSKISYNKTQFLNFEQFYFSVNGRYVAFNHWVNIENEFAPLPDAYFIAGLEFGGQLKNFPIHTSIKFQNIFNQTYRDYLNRFRYFADEQGFNFIFTAKYQFRKKSIKNEKS